MQCWLELVNVAMVEYNNNFLNIVFDTNDHENNKIAFHMIYELRWINKFITASNDFIIKKFMIANYSNQTLELSYFNKNVEELNDFSIWKTKVNNLLEKWKQLLANLVSSHNVLAIIKYKIKNKEIIANVEGSWEKWENNLDNSLFLAPSGESIDKDNVEFISS